MKIPPPQDTLAGRIYSALQRENTEPPRPHLGASLIGHKCERWLWLSFRWAVREEFEGRILRLFRRGHHEESWVFRDLEAAGVKVQAFDPETGKQWRINAGGHFSGSMDGIILSGVPEAPKTKHVLEIKTHSVKSFADLESKGVKASKPQHWAQMQLYMLHTSVDRALYFAVCKDDDRIYTERVELDKQEAQRLTDKAHRIIESDRMPPPLSTDPTWFECKFCAAHDLCHGSKLAKQSNCRTCAHSTPLSDGTWHCAHWDSVIPGADAQLAGCDEHVIHPDLTPGWQYEPANTGVIWLTPAGKIHNASDGYKSREIMANWKACAAGVRDEYAGFEPEIVG